MACRASAPGWTARRSSLHNQQLICRRAQHWLLLACLDQLHIETERLQLADEHVKRFRHARFHGSFALNDGLVNLGAAVYVIGLRRQQLLKNERRAVRFQRPNFHLSKALPAELRLTTQGLLGYQRIRPDGARVDLVVHQVRQLQHVDVTDRDRLLELVASHAVVQSRFAGLRQACALQQRLDFILTGTVEHRRPRKYSAAQAFCDRHQFIVGNVGNLLLQGRALEQVLQFAANGFFARILLQELGDLLSEFMSRPSEVGFKNLTHVHTGGNAQRIQHNLNRSAVFEVRHVLIGQDAGNHTLISVTAGHLVAHAQLALHGDIDFDQLDHARRQLVALGQLVFLFIDDLLQNVNLTRGHLFDFVDLLIHPRIFVVVLNTLQIPRRDTFDSIAIENCSFGQQALVGALVVQIGLHFFSAKNAFQTLQSLVGQNSDLVGKVLLEFRNLSLFNRLRALVLFLAFAGEDFYIHDHAFDSRRTVERRVANVSGFFTENGAQQLLFRGQLGFALGRDLTYQNVALLHSRANADHARFIKIAQHGLADVGNVASNFFRPQLGIAGFDFEFLDMDGGVVILFHQLFGDQNRVFEVVSTPRHESHQHVAPERQFATVGARPVGNDLAFHDALSAFDHRLLVDTGVLVRALELGQLINIAAHFSRKLPWMVLAFHAHDDAFGIN